MNSAVRKACLSATLFFVVAVITARQSAFSTEAADCWRGFLADAGASERQADDLAIFRMGGHELRVPLAYLGGRPPAEIHPEGAVRLVAWPPRFTPVTPQQSRGAFEPGGQGMVLTLEVQATRLHGQALLDMMIRAYGHRHREGERNADGFLIYRAAPPNEDQLIIGEVYVWPGDPDRIFSCSAGIGLSRFPQCRATRRVGGTINLTLSFPKTLLPDYLTLEASVNRVMGCSLNAN